MARKFGKSKARKQDPQPQQDPRHMFGAPPLPRQAGNPASSAPLADHLGRAWPGVDERYVVLPRSLAESMPLPWQQQMANLLAQFQHAHGHLSWPAYRVVPSRHERLVDLDEEQLAEAGYLIEIDHTGETVYRERNGRKVENPQDTVVLVPCLDPIAGSTSVASRPPEPAHEPSAPQQQQTRAPAPMNVGPQPVWPTPENTPAETGESAASRAPDEPETPPRGTAQRGTAQRDWFDEMPVSDPAETDRHQDFGPTGEPTEIPYRCRE